MTCCDVTLPGDVENFACRVLERLGAPDLLLNNAAVALNPGIIDTRMLRSCFGGAAGDFPEPRQWAESAVPFLAALGPKDNGRPLTVPDGVAASGQP